MNNEYTERQRKTDTAKVLLAIAYLLAAEVLLYYIFPVPVELLP
jgi:hypothetical protein